MTISAIYRATLRLLPSTLRSKHGAAMEQLFDRELDNARAKGSMHVAFVGTMSVLDVVRRSVYELLRTLPTRANPHNQQVQGFHMNDPRVELPTTQQLLGRLAISFTFAFAALTSVLLSQFVLRHMPAATANVSIIGAVAKMVWLALPFTAAMTIPMAVFVGVIHEFTRLGAKGALALARRERDGMRRLIVPVFAAATGVAVIAFVVCAVVVPRANAQLAVSLGAPRTPLGQRSMTIGELRAAAQTAVQSAEPVELARVASFEVEVQKKFALSVACIVFAIVAVALAFRIPRGGLWLTFAASIIVFSAYYFLVVTGETLADRMIVSPFIGMWTANVCLLGFAFCAAALKRSSGKDGRTSDTGLRAG